MVEKTATIKNAHGIHCRPSAVIVKHVKGYEGSIEVMGEKGTADLTSIMELMMLELFVGSQVKIRVSGPDEEKICDELVELFETHFDFPSQEA